MKIRTDFVTNSSSSSYIIARNKELTEKQKEVILNYVVKNFFGGDREITEENLEKEIDGHYNVGKLRKDINRALGEGKKVYKGSVCFEIPYSDFGDMYKALWKELKDADPDAFDEIVADFGAWW